MFTGLIQAIGVIGASEPRGVDLRLQINQIGPLRDDLTLGASISVNGVCLTATELTADGFWADVSKETLDCTATGGLAVGGRVNLEPALRVGDRLGGHWVSGHVDGIGEVKRFYEDGRSWRLVIETPAALTRYIAPKGSICVDGVSLTVNGVEGRVFDVNIVPHTLEHTIIGDYAPGRLVNLEADVVARYLESLLAGDAGANRAGVSLETLVRSGFVGRTDDGGS
ncbi:MAG: riboflavin synthase [Pseudomonadota bacterium]|nr:riboflavin synthase [Pseudomonadota bacterium]